jgi:membrane-associated protease RseP (regulator of RpoE activity)
LAERGRPLSEPTQEVGLGIGFALVAMLVISSTALDIMRLVALGGG